MNRKRQAKLAKAVQPTIVEHPFDNIENWYKGDAQNCPWPQWKMREFQKRIDSAFGAENAFILAWSPDRTYGDEFLNEKGKLEKKPVLLFSEEKVGEYDYLYVVPLRFVILEVLHGSQLEDGWEAASYVTDEHGIAHRIRAEKPPEFFYKVAKVIARHERPIVRGGEPPCCKRFWDYGRNICYGKYRIPAEEDIAFIRAIREKLDEMGIAQRNDAPRSAKLLQYASLATKHYMEQAKNQRKRAVQEMIMSDPHYYMGDVFKNYGITMSAPEIERTLKEGFERDECN